MYDICIYSIVLFLISIYYITAQARQAALKAEKEAAAAALAMAKEDAQKKLKEMKTTVGVEMV